MASGKVCRYTRIIRVHVIDMPWWIGLVGIASSGEMKGFHLSGESAPARLETR